jgi:cyclopropane-fatty-acyl-phospholipid synthase
MSVQYATEWAGSGRPRVAELIEPVLERVADGALRARPLAVRFWDGSILPARGPAASRSGSADPGLVPTLVVRSPQALAYLLRDPGEVGLGRAWIAGALDFDGDIGAVLDWRTQLRDLSLGARDRVLALLTAIRAAGLEALRVPPPIEAEARPQGRRHSLSRDRAAIRHHYDVSNEFYSLILGPSMVYSCAYYDSPDDSLERAQERKLELICRKLQLRPGDRMLDIGCGWGSLILHAATRHGVRALGVTLSEAQAELARERIREAGVEDRCEVRVADYRELVGEQFDRIASVGMYEHVGRDQLATYVRQVRRLLVPGGSFLNHGITRLTPGPKRRGTFISRFVFPDGELHPLPELVSAMHEAHLEIRDVESLREHYALTLRAWVRNLEANRDAAIQQVGAERERIWRLYMSGSAHAFATGEISVFQTLAVNPGARHRLPLDRLRLLRGSAKARSARAVEEQLQETH